MDTKQILAFNILSDRRGRSELERDRRLKEYYLRYPVLFEIDKEIKIYKAELLLEIAKNQGHLVGRAGLSDLEEKKTRYLLAQGISPDYDQSIPFCAMCADTGYVNGTACTCLKELMIPGLLEASGLNLYSGISFDDFSEEYFANQTQIRTLRAVSESYARGFPGQTRNHLFWGNPGTGKTYMAVCIAKKVVESAVSVLFIRVSDLLETMGSYRTMMQSFSPDADRLSSVTAKRDLILNGGLLVIDELGIEAKGPNTISDLLQILGSRTQQKLPTLITTNLSLPDLQKTYDNRVYSRLMGDFIPFHFEGDDIRISQRYHHR